MNSKRKGSIAIAEAIKYFTEKGQAVFIPVSDCDKYDIVVDDGTLKKVQCKFTNKKENSNSYRVSLWTYGGYREKVKSTFYKQGDFDLLFIVTGNHNIFLIPEIDVIGKSQITISTSPTSPWRKYCVNLISI